MKTFTTLATSSLLLFHVGSSFAEIDNSVNHFYIGGTFGWQSADVSVTDSDNLTPHETTSSSSMLKGGGIIGFMPAALDHWRFEFAFNRAENDAEQDFMKGLTEYELDADLNVNSYELNAIRDFDTSIEGLKPFVSVSLGYYDGDFNYKRSEEAILGGKTYKGGNLTDSGLGYSLGGGVSYYFTDQIAADLAYRYTDTGLKFGANELSTVSELAITDLGIDDRFSELTASVRYVF